MQNYETIIVINPSLSDAEISEFVDKTKGTITKGGGAILSEDSWGRRKLAYPIRKLREGYYVYLKFSAPGALVNKMNQQFRIQESILRTLTVHAEEAKRNGAKSKPNAKAKAST
ncbi:MAG: 30S ribosomal protein S6 [Elusimicrobiota bacterium]